jgi:hypothetical protein
MKRLILKSLLYFFLTVLVLEVLVRAFHLTKDYPVRFVDSRGVERWVPNQEGHSVTGNRRQNFSKFNINSSGYNSYRDFEPTKDKTELALVGDSFIEGFHQDYFNSIGKKIETILPEMEVYEIGYAGYDFADQLHLIHQYQSFFDLIDYVVIGISFEDDLTRSSYEVLPYRMKLESPQYRAMRKLKLLVYLQNIGAFDALRAFAKASLSLDQDTSEEQEEDASARTMRYLNYIENFEQLVHSYGYDNERFVLLLDKDHTPTVFLNYLHSHHYNYIDFGQVINHSHLPTTLIYDMHWNNYGRQLVAKLIAKYIQQQQTHGTN